jgi:hypothetical protein
MDSLRLTAMVLMALCKLSKSSVLVALNKPLLVLPCILQEHIDLWNSSLTTSAVYLKNSETMYLILSNEHVGRYPPTVLTRIVDIVAVSLHRSRSSTHYGIKTIMSLNPGLYQLFLQCILALEKMAHDT